MQDYKKYVCSDQKCEATIYIKVLAYRKLIEKIEKYKNETGGILIGYYSTSLRTVFINEFGDAPVDSKSGYSYFVRGVKGLGNYLKKKWNQYNEYYLGEWHFHPANVPEPSVVDMTQLRIIAIDERFNCKEPILIICYKENESVFNITIRLLLNSGVYDFIEAVD